MILSIIEDDPVILKSLLTFFEVNKAIELSHHATSVESFLEIIETQKQPICSMLLLDIGLPGMSGLEAIPIIKEKLPDTDIVMFTTYEEEDAIFEALCKGACSYITKRTSLAKLQESLYIIHNGGSYMSPSIARKVVQHFIEKKKPKKEVILTDRQNQIVTSIVDGNSYKMVAAELAISIETVRDHIKKIYRALHIHSKAELIRKRLKGEI